MRTASGLFRRLAARRPNLVPYTGAAEPVMRA